MSISSSDDMSMLNYPTKTQEKNTSTVFPITNDNLTTNWTDTINSNQNIVGKFPPLSREVSNQDEYIITAFGVCFTILAIVLVVIGGILFYRKRNRNHHSATAKAGKRHQDGGADVILTLTLEQNTADSTKDHEEFVDLDNTGTEANTSVALLLLNSSDA